MNEVRCAGCGQYRDATTRLHEVRRRLAVETARADDYERGLKNIIWVLRDKQPAPRNASVSYVAGYARAMDDMRVAILEAVELHMRGRVASAVATTESRDVPPGPTTSHLPAPEWDQVGPGGTPGTDF